MLRDGRRFKILMAIPITLVMLVAMAAIASATLTSTWTKSYQGPVDYTITDPVSTDTTRVAVISSFYSVSALDATNSWAVGSAQEQLYMRYPGDETALDPDPAALGPRLPLIGVTSNGSDWSVVTLPGFSGALLGVDAVDSTHVWAVGEAGLILKWNGTSWARSAAGVTASNLRAVSFADVDNGWAVGDGGTILRTTDSGVTWTKPASGTTLNLNSVSAPTTSTVLAVGAGGVACRWNGSSWSVQNPSSYELRGVTALDATHAWAVGEQNTFLTWNGSAWTARAVPPFGAWSASDMKPLAVDFTSVLDGIAVGESSFVWRTSDGGVTWEPSQLPDDIAGSGNVFLRSVARAPGAPLGAWVVGSGLAMAVAPDAYIYRGVLSAPPIGALTGTVSGGGASLAGVSVKVGSLTATLTASNGSYTVEDILPGTYSVVYSKSGYTTQTVSTVIPGSTLTQNVTLVAEPLTYTLKYAAGANGTISSGSTSQIVDYNGSGSAVTAAPATGYRFTGWSDGKTANPRTDTNVVANVDVTAEFAPLTYTITASADAYGSISPPGASTVASGTSLALTITPVAGYQVAYVLVDGGSVGAVTSYTFTNVTADHTISAVFSQIPPSSSGTPSTPSTPTLVRHARNFSTFGYIIRHPSGSAPVTLYFYRYQSRRWVLKKSITAKVSNWSTFSRYSKTTSVPTSGRWRVRARHKVGSRYRYSPYAYFNAN
ncbi:MAG: YCF48-related protein [Coriobacteriia bacterium]|nr:YCF48-related protein [Coriobacteriia bacterium]